MVLYVAHIVSICPLYVPVKQFAYVACMCSLMCTFVSDIYVARRCETNVAVIHDLVYMSKNVVSTCGV